jgi:hypothetical protein
MAGDAGSGPRPGAVTAVVAALGLLLGAGTGYNLARQDSAPRILLRQAAGSPFGSSGVTTGTGTISMPGTGIEVEIPIVNDSAAAVEVVGAAMAGQTPAVGPAAPTVDIAPAGIAEVVITIPSQNRCGNVAMDTQNPVEITVFARLQGAQNADAQPVPVQITGPSASYLAGCAL